ncbi:hypothetical protein [Burkholderia cenocepacia]|uniref:hypothetical protein n=1 Tax=Burkholderia cenocepacia TaxID=95486 RepID=UPI00264F65BA|nr:hypothetical protein [Burkholderia cenocepacia]MDN7452319.1 hypothetical protein [Burkholderia cenocepacia]
MNALTLALAGERNGGDGSTRVLTDEEVVAYSQNLSGIAMYVAEYGRCRAMLDARQK